MLHQCRTGIDLCFLIEMSLVSITSIESSIGMSKFRWFDHKGIIIVGTGDVQWMRIVTKLLQMRILNYIGIGTTGRGETIG